MRTMVGIGVAVLSLSGAMLAGARAAAPQTGTPAAVAAPSGRVAEVPVAGMVRRDMYTVAVGLPGKRIVKNIECALGARGAAADAR